MRNNWPNISSNLSYLYLSYCFDVSKQEFLGVVWWSSWFSSTLFWDIVLVVLSSRFCGQLGVFLLDLFRCWISKVRKPKIGLVSYLLDRASRSVYVVVLYLVGSIDLRAITLLSCWWKSSQRINGWFFLRIYYKSYSRILELTLKLKLLVSLNETLMSTGKYYNRPRPYV